MVFSIIRNAEFGIRNYLCIANFSEKSYDRYANSACKILFIQQDLFSRKIFESRSVFIYSIQHKNSCVIRSSEQSSTEIFPKNTRLATGGYRIRPYGNGFLNVNLRNKNNSEFLIPNSALISCIYLYKKQTKGTCYEKIT